MAADCISFQLWAERNENRGRRKAAAVFAGWIENRLLDGPGRSAAFAQGIAHAYILDLATSTVRRLRPDFAASAHPVWNPDGTHIVFVGLKDARNTDSYNWWITTAVENSPAVKCRDDW